MKGVVWLCKTKSALEQTVIQWVELIIRTVTVSAFFNLQVIAMIYWSAMTGNVTGAQGCEL